ncbi:TlyA family RNA methyltransferase [Thermoproteota archaeon]
MAKIRLDQLLVQTKLIDSPAKAQAMIMSGKVLVNNQKITKAGHMTDPGSIIRLLKSANRYVSRGGDKLEGAFKAFDIPVKGRIAIDIGVSTGGFSHFLLKNDVKIVFGVDVGYGQIDLKLRNDPRVMLLERCNARTLTKQNLVNALKKKPEAVSYSDEISLVVMDVSFISVTKILPVIQRLTLPETDYVILIKPQFEAEKSQVERGGIIKDQALRDSVVTKVEQSLASKFKLIEKIPSPITGAKGNQEYFFWLRNKSGV